MAGTALQSYLESAITIGRDGRPDASRVDAGLLAYLANLENVARVAPNIAAAIVQELADQRRNIKLIASENYCSLAVQCAMANLLTDKYAEGVPAEHTPEGTREGRYYAGCDNVDVVEDFARRQACKLFNAEHAYVQPHSGADANLVAFWTILTARVQNKWTERLSKADPDERKKILGERTDAQYIRYQLGNQRLLALDFACGGHLTHGKPENVSAKMFEAHHYKVDPTTGLMDYTQIERLTGELKPLILLAGYSAYPRKIDFERMRAIADKHGAVFMVDMAHFAGLVAGGVFEGPYNPIPYSHVVTTTTHKTLRGPRGGMVLCTREFKEVVDKGCPLVLGGPLPHVLAAKAICFTEALRPEFKQYARDIVRNSQALSAACIERGLTVLTGGSDNHIVLLDVRPQGITGFQAEAALRKCGITLNRNAIPGDPEKPMITSGLRLGTPAVTTLGMGGEEMTEIADAVALVLKNTRRAILTSGKSAGTPSKREFELADSIEHQARDKVSTLLDRYPVYPQLDLNVFEPIALP